MVTLFSKYDSTIVFWCSIAYNMAYIPPPKKNVEIHTCQGPVATPRLHPACQMPSAIVGVPPLHQFVVPVTWRMWTFLDTYVTFNSPKCDNSIPLLLLHVTEPFPTATQNGTPENQDPASKYLATREEGVNSNKLWATSDLDQTLELFKSRAVPPSEILMAPWTCNTTYNYRACIWGWLLGQCFVAVKWCCPAPNTTLSMRRPTKKSLKKRRDLRRGPSRSSKKQLDDPTDRIGLPPFFSVCIL